MPPVDNPPGPTNSTVPIYQQELVNLIRDTLRSEMAVQKSQKDTADAYIQRLQNIDAKVESFIEQAINETTHAYQISVDSVFVGYLAAFFILLFGLGTALLYPYSSQLFTIAILFIAIGVIWILNLQSKNLTKSNKTMVNNLAKLNIVFAGYIRQIHQVDAIFQAFMGSSKEITVEVAEQLLNNLQDAMIEAMNAVTAITSESDD
jgi:hypothetical protein